MPHQFGYVATCLSIALPLEPKAGAQCISSARRDLCEGCRVTGIPIATGASLYKAFEPEIAHRLMEKLEFVYTPKHGSWLNMAECEFSALLRQCLNRRLGDKKSVRREVDAWTATRNRDAATVERRFATEDARIKLKQLYPAISS